jgi:hypothetical protein
VSKVATDASLSAIFSSASARALSDDLPCAVATCRAASSYDAGEGAAPEPGDVSSVLRPQRASTAPTACLDVVLAVEAALERRGWSEAERIRGGDTEGRHLAPVEQGSPRRRT